jgi:hypothetical protein
MFLARTVFAASAPFSRAGGDGVSDFARQAVEASAEHARIVEWADRIRQADTAVAWLIVRPQRRPPQISYPSAVAAYRELEDVLKAL